jgi:hypothetical protein
MSLSGNFQSGCLHDSDRTEYRTRSVHQHVDMRLSKTFEFQDQAGALCKCPESTGSAEYLASIRAAGRQTFARHSARHTTDV